MLNQYLDTEGYSYCKIIIPYFDVKLTKYDDLKALSVHLFTESGCQCYGWHITNTKQVLVQSTLKTVFALHFVNSFPQLSSFVCISLGISES